MKKITIIAMSVGLMCLLALGMVSCTKNEHTHVFGEWEIAVSSSCATQGELVRTCLDCGMTERELIDAEGHQYEDTVVAPTKTERGYTAHRCKVCSEQFHDSYIPAIGSLGLTHEYIVTDEEVSCIITGIGSCTDSELYIPAMIGKYPVSAVGSSAFKGDSRLERVTIPSGITQIQSGAFRDCINLKTVALSDTVNKIGSAAFLGCEQLSGVYIDDLFSWCNIEFASDCSNPLWYAEKLYLNHELVTNVTIPDGITQIGHWAFANCVSLSSVMIPNSVTQIGCQAFYNCALESVVLPDSVEYLDAATFSYCKKLTSVAFSKGLKEIYISAFRGCSGLQSVNIPQGVTAICADAFKDCSSLKSVNIPQSVTEIGANVFENCNSLSSIIFEDTEGWQGFRTYEMTGTAVSFSDSTNNVTYFTTYPYVDYYWKRF